MVRNCSFRYVLGDDSLVLDIENGTLFEKNVRYMTVPQFAYNYYANDTKYFIRTGSQNPYVLCEQS